MEKAVFAALRGVSTENNDFEDDRDGVTAKVVSVILTHYRDKLKLFPKSEPWNDKAKVITCFIGIFL